jgi:hydroxyethylthiazole kinase-like uncharacterized protein yjeF
MLYALTSEQARAAEDRAVASGAVTLASLMERAGGVVAGEALRMVAGGTIVVVAGRGNNGGDGWVAARDLAAAGRAVELLSVAHPDTLGEPAASAARGAIAAGVAWRPLASVSDLGRILAESSLVIDAVFGVGFHAPAEAQYASLLAEIAAIDTPVLSIDMPSGVNADTGAADASAVRAAVTVTFSAPKAGLLLYPGADHAGEVYVADIGIAEDHVRAVAKAGALPRDEFAKLLPLPDPRDHKNSRGRVLVVAGSPGMTGAAALAASGALRMGAGFVRLGVPASLVGVMSVKLTPVVVHALSETANGTLASAAVDQVLKLAETCDAVVLGPGLTTASQTAKAARRLVRESPVPMVVDADALNALAGSVERVLAARTAPTVLTPHPGELGSLLGITSSEVQSDRLASGARLATDRVAVVLKGARTIVSGEGRQYITMTGNAGMATAGTGDVLAGMIGALLAQGLSPLQAGSLAAYVHGRAGDFAAFELTETCITAEDVLAHLPDAVRELVGG